MALALRESGPGEGSDARAASLKPSSGALSAGHLLPHRAFGRTPVFRRAMGRTEVAMDDPILTLNAVGKRFPGVIALRGVSLEIGRGEGHVLLGENGAGKSTLINLLAGVYQADDGDIAFDGEA